MEHQVTAKPTVDENRVVQLLIDLCRADSAPLKEKNVFDLVFAAMQELGFSVREDDAAAKIGGQVGNIIATKPGKGRGVHAEPLMFSAHMDRVAGGIGVKPQLVDGVIKSDGTTILGADDAAGLAAVIEACRVLVESDMDHPPLEVVFTVAEEIGLLGARAVDVSSLRSKMGFVLDADAPVGAIIRAAPTQYTIVARLFGRSAHAGVAPEKGISAIKIAASAVSKMRLGRIDSETTANVGYIAGGGPTNIVPEQAEIHAETRSLNRDKVERQLESMKRALKSAAETNGGRAEWDVTLEYESFWLDEDDEVVRRSVQAAQSLGLTGSLHETGGGSDANVFNARGLPTVVLGVGYQAIHTHREHMRVSELVRLSELVVALTQTGM